MNNIIDWDANDGHDGCDLCLIPCLECDGYGYFNGETCEACDGDGEVYDYTEHQVDDEEYDRW